MRNETSISPESSAELPGEVRRLADRIWRSHTENGADGDLARLPSERQLSSRYGVTRYSINSALKLLEDEGLLVRLPRSGSFVRRKVAPPRDASAARCTCLNFIQAPSMVSEQMQWILRDYLSGYTEALEHRHLKTRFVSCADDCADFEGLFWPHTPLSRQACVLVNRRSPALLNWLREQQVPFVLQCQYRYDDAALPDHHKVYINKAGGGFQAARHLLDLGHREVGYIGETPGGAGAYPIYEGFAAAMLCTGRAVNEEHVLRLVLDVMPGDLTAFIDYLRRPNAPTAVLTGNDYTAIALLQAARVLGRKVPEELSIVGVNDQADAQQTDPPLTTVRIPRREFARAAVEMILGAAEGQLTSWQTKILECELVQRRTTAPPG